MEQKLFKACINGDLPTVKGLINSNEVNWNAQDSNTCERTALHHACFSGHVEIVHLLLALRRVDLNAEDKFGITPLHYACGNGHLEIAQSLYTSNEVNVNTRNYKDGNTPLHYACKHGHLKIVRSLCTLNEVDVNEKNNDGYSPLHYACEHNYLKIACFLLEVEGADYTVQNKKGSTPKDLAAKKYHIPVVKYLENVGNNSNLSSSFQKLRRLQRSYEKKIISLVLHQDDALGELTKTLFETGLNEAEDLKSFAQCITSIEDIAIVCSIVKFFTKRGRLPLEESFQVVKHILTGTLDQKSRFMNQDYVSIKSLLDELNNQKLISEDNYYHWDQQILMLNVETASMMNDKDLNIFINSSVYQILRTKYDELHDYYVGFRNACKKNLEDEITLGLLQVGVSMLRLLPLKADLSGSLSCAMDISDPVHFCSFIFEKKYVNAFMKSESDELVLKPIVRYILEKSKIDEKEFISVLRDLTRTTTKYKDIANGTHKLVIAEWMDNIQPSSYVKDRSDKNSVMDDTISEISSARDETIPHINKHTNMMDLTDLCRVLKGSIGEDDFVDKLANFQYITALQFSEGDVSVFKRAVKYISTEYSANETAKLCIKREDCEDIQTEITAVQYAAICGYVDILEEFFLSEAQAEHIDFGLNYPVFYFVFASKQQKLLKNP